MRFEKKSNPVIPDAGWGITLWLFLFFLNGIVPFLMGWKMLIKSIVWGAINSFTIIGILILAPYIKRKKI